MGWLGFAPRPLGSGIPPDGLGSIQIPGERRAEVSPTSAQKGHTLPRLALHWLKQATWVGPTSMKERVYPPVRGGAPGRRAGWTSDVGGRKSSPLHCAPPRPVLAARALLWHGSFRCKCQRPPGCPLATAPHPPGHLVSFLKNVLNKMGIFLDKVPATWHDCILKLICFIHISSAWIERQLLLMPFSWPWKSRLTFFYKHLCSGLCGSPLKHKVRAIKGFTHRSGRIYLQV